MGLDDNGIARTYCFVSNGLPGYYSIFFSLFNNDRIIQSSLYQSDFYFPIPVTYKWQKDANNDHDVGYSI
jgi:hypothetical protein